MALEEVSFTEGLDTTLAIMQEHGLLLSSADEEGNPNVMTIGWGGPTLIWSRPVFVALVRPSRFTFSNIEATGQFVVSVPTPEMHEVCMHCGTVSGREHDKFRECNLSLTEAASVEVPLIEQCIAHYECEVRLRSDVIDSQLDRGVRSDYYSNGNFHRIYYGEIVRATRQK